MSLVFVCEWVFFFWTQLRWSVETETFEKTPRDRLETGTFETATTTLQFTFAKIIKFYLRIQMLRNQQIAINVGLSWPHFSWPTQYIRNVRAHPLCFAHLHLPLTPCRLVADRVEAQGKNFHTSNALYLFRDINNISEVSLTTASRWTAHTRQRGSCRDKCSYLITYLAEYSKRL